MNFALYMFYFSLFCFPLLSSSAIPSNSAIVSLLSHPNPSLFFTAFSSFIEALLCSSPFHCSSPCHCFTLLYSLRFLFVPCTSLLRPPPRTPTKTGHRSFYHHQSYSGYTQPPRVHTLQHNLWFRHRCVLSAASFRFVSSSTFT
ncbi:hypothetical protein QL285_094077 [Trifolium repens]|nr:hypothetical protein QL285_094077 [Trifolium repens]